MTRRTSDHTQHRQGQCKFFIDLSIYIPKCYEGIEYNYQPEHGTVYIVSGDDGYNAAGGAGRYSTGTNPRQGGMSTTRYAQSQRRICVNSASGDHDAFDSNGNLTITGGYYCANGQEPMDKDGTLSQTGGNYISMTAGNTNLTTRYTFVDGSGNVLVSFMSASGTPSKSFKDSSLKLYSGGTVSGGTAVVTAQGFEIYTCGTLSGGTQK